MKIVFTLQIYYNLFSDDTGKYEGEICIAFIQDPQCYLDVKSSPICANTRAWAHTQG